VGFNLYSDLLDRAVQSLKAGKEPALEKPLEQSADVDLHIPALLPEDYLPDVHTRLVMYKRIANADGDGALRELQVEMIDRFGLLPEPARNLLEIARIRQRVQAMGITRLEVGPGGGIVQFGESPQVDAGALVRLVQEKPAVYRLEGQERLRFTRETDTAAARIELVDQLLASMAMKEAA